MKVNIEIDCTPQEARMLMGLPDVAPLQEAAMARLTAQFEEQMDRFDAEAIMKAWLTPNWDAFSQMQKMFQAAATPPRQE